MKIHTQPARRKGGALLALGVAGLLTLTACGSSSNTLTKEEGGADPNAIPSTDVVKAVKEDKALHDQLPDAIKTAGVINVGATVQAGVSFLPQGGQDAKGNSIGLQADIINQIGKKLGVKINLVQSEFAAIIPAVGSRFDIGQGNFAILAARLATVDQVSYLVDGQSLLARKDLPINSISALTDVCGYKITTGSGSSFQAILEANKDACAKVNKTNWTVTYLDDNAAILQALQSGQQDIQFGPSTSVSYIAKHQPKVAKDLGEISWTTVGYAIPKGSPLGPILRDAINALIKDGDYQKVFEKWSVPQDAVKTSTLVTSPTQDPALVGAQTTKR